MADRAPDILSLDGRLALRPEEAAKALGISENKLRAMLVRLPHLRDGNVLLIPVRDLREWLSAQAKLQTGVPARADAVLAEILTSTRGGRAGHRE